MARMIVSAIALALSLSLYGEHVVAAEIREPLLAKADAAADSADFPLLGTSAPADIYVDTADAAVVQIAAKLLGDDIERVTSKHPTVKNDPSSLGQNAVIVGTLGQNKVVDQLVADGKIDVAAVKGKWESFIIQTVDHPLPGVDRALVIIGSDRRGTAYGVFELSEQIGVSPWYYWADVTPTHRAQLTIKAGRHVVDSPTVKYRGIFINDEDWGLTAGPRRRMILSAATSAQDIREGLRTDAAFERELPLAGDARMQHRVRLDR